MKKITCLVIMLAFLIAMPLYAQPKRLQLSKELEELIIDAKGPFTDLRVRRIRRIFLDEREKTKATESPQANAMSTGVHVLTWLIMWHADDRDDASKAVDPEEAEFGDEAQEQFLEVVKILLYAGALIDEPDLDENTPLHEAVRRNHLELVKLLLSKRPNAKLNHRNRDGKTPYDLAATDEMRELLMRYMPQVVINDGGALRVGALVGGIPSSSMRGNTSNEYHNNDYDLGSGGLRFSAGLTSSASNGLSDY